MRTGAGYNCWIAMILCNISRWQTSNGATYEVLEQPLTSSQCFQSSRSCLNRLRDQSETQGQHVNLSSLETSRLDLLKRPAGAAEKSSLAKRILFEPELQPAQLQPGPKRILKWKQVRTVCSFEAFSNPAFQESRVK